MELKIYQVDAFATTVFKGNPAAVCPLTTWLNDDILQNIAFENNLSETAFYVPVGENRFEIRWFTPTTEVALCGHATLASAFVLHTQEGFEGDLIQFESRFSGTLPVKVEQDLYILNFPTDQIEPLSLNADLLELTDQKPVAAFKGKTDILLVFENQQTVEILKPRLASIKKLVARGIIVTAPGQQHDFVSRFFGPAVGVDEDPVCGSAHTTLAPYWADQLNKNDLTAWQASQRTGELRLKFLGDRVEIAGKAVLYLQGILKI